MTTDPLLRFRDEFPILAHTTYLVSNSLGAMPRGVPERLAEYAQMWAEHGVRAWARGWWEMPIAVGDQLAPLIGAAAGEIAMVPTVSQAQASVFSSLSYDAPRNRIVMTELDFPSVRYVHAELAERLGVNELAELAASVSLAGSHGARIRASLAAKADTLRGHQIAETEASAEAATERMTVPVAVLLFGFLVFIAYPAIAQITSVSGAQP